MKPDLIKAAEDVIMLEFKATDTFGDAKKKFFAIMLKRGVCKGTRIKGGGIQCDNFEWTALYTLFLDSVRRYYALGNLFDKSPKLPKALEAYSIRKRSKSPRT